MAAKSFLRLINGYAQGVFGVQQSAGAANAGDIPALNDQGYLDTTLMPPGIGADTQMVQASEALNGGDFVNIYDGGSGVFRCRKADASAGLGKRAHGYLTSNVTAGGNATVFFEGTNASVTGQAPGDVFLSAATPGRATATPPSGSGQIVQPLGVATSASSINVEIDQPTVLA